ncbi:MAG: murein biosynthesis integral membrane protein MurJ [Clostridiales bacterium]|nr:murein biosynthesis integral membrane protein MurJ [Clostridiales bacterium]
MINNGNKKESKAVKTVVVMMGATVIAKLLGMLRGVLQARCYGTTPEANAFTAASKLPLAFFDMFLAAAVLGCFIPVYNSFANKDGSQDSDGADKFASVFICFISLLCGLLALVGIIFADPLIKLITRGLDTQTLALAVTLTRIMFPLVIFTGAAYTLVGVLQSKGSFIAPAMISAISNAGVVVYLAFINNPLGDNGIYGLAVAYMLSWLVQLLTLVVPLKRMGFKFRLLLDLNNPALRRAIKMAPPIMAGSWLSPVGVLLGQYFAAKISTYSGISGATTVFDYANNVYVIIAGTLTYSICNYTFPKISRLAVSGDEVEYAETVRNGLKSALYIVVPFMAAALVLAGEGVTILYRRGIFTPEDAEYTAAALRAILPAMPLFCVTELFTRVFYSRNQVRIPMYAAIIGILANILTGTILTHFQLIGISAVGAANAAGQAAAAIVLIIFAAKRIPGLINRKLIADVLKLLLGGVIVFALCTIISTLVASEPYTASILTNIIKALIIFLPSAAVYFVYTKLCHLSFTA